jgi:hypothetical protein
MVKNLRPLSDKLTSVDWLNAIRNTLGSEYQSRIPEATQANVTETINQIFEYSATRNQVVEALVNRIGTVLVRNTSWTNPLAEFKIGMLEQGDTIEEVMNGLLDAIDYDFDRDELEKELFGNHPFETQSRFHKINRRDRYVFTINTIGLRMALLNNELPQFLSTAMQMPFTSDQNDEFLLMMNLFKEFDTAAAGGIHTVHVDDVGDEASDSAASRFMLRRLREYSNTLPFISRLYNPAGMPVATRPEDLMLLTTASADAAMDVEALAGAFNISKAEFGSRKLVIPERFFGIDGVQAILTTRQFFVVADSLLETTSLFNPAKLTTNYWFHHHQVMSASPFAPFVMFNSERPSTVISTVETPVTDIGAFTFTDSAGTVEATALKRGTLYDVRVEGVTTPAGGVAALDLDIIGATSQFTYITNNGSLFVAPNEEAATLTIRATAIDGSGYYEETTRTTKGDLVIPWPDPQVIPDSDSDALEEVTPVKPDFTANVITIPSERGVLYKEGATPLVNGAKLTVANGTPRTITAEARPTFELATGVTTSWVFTYVAP